MAELSELELPSGAGELAVRISHATAAKAGMTAMRDRDKSQPHSPTAMPKAALLIASAPGPPWVSNIPAATIL